MSETADTQSSLAFRIAFALLYVVSVVAILAGVLLLFARYLFVAELINNFRLQISLAIFVLSFALHFAGEKYLRFIGICIGFFVLSPIALNWLPPVQPEPGPKRLTLLAYNVYGENPNQQPIVETIQNHFADVTVVVEYENEWEEALEVLDRSYRYSIKELRWHGFGIALFSKFPIADSQVHMLANTKSDFPLVVAEIHAKNQKMIVVAGHFLSPLKAMKMEIRNQQIFEVSEIISDINKSKNLPVILVGDFNCVAWSPYLSDLMRECALRDARRGYPYQGTWPTDNLILQIPIDNTFVSDKIHIHNRTVLPADNSDHFPVLTEFSIAEKD